MTFLAPLLLATGIALAVPILLHLVRRPDEHRVDFPALRYLMATARDQARSIRLRQLLLLLVRVAAVACLVLAAARIVVPFGGRTHPPAAVVVVIDNGIGSSAVVEGARVLDLLVERARRAVATLGPRDRVWVLAAGEPWRTSFPGDVAAADSVLATLEPTAVQASLPAAVARAATVLEAAEGGPRQILVVSDLRGDALRDGDATDPAADADEERPPVPPVLITTAAVELPPNRRVASIRVGGGLPPRAGDVSEAEVEIGGVDRDAVAVRLHIDGELVAAGRTDAEGRAVLALPALPEGSFTGSAEIDPDPLRADDRRYFALVVRPAPTVIRVGSPAPYLEQALAALDAGGRVRLVANPAAAEIRIVSGDAATEPGTLPGGTRGVTRIVVVLPPSDASRLPALNRWLEGTGAAWRLEPPGPEAERTLEPSPWLPSSIQEVAVRRSHRILPRSADEGESGEVRVRLSNGEPWLVEAASASPPLRLLATGFGPEATDLPFSAAMIPVLDRILDPPGSAEEAHGVTAGGPISLPLGIREVRVPDGTRIPMDGLASFAQTARPGVHELLGDDGEVVARVAVNPPGGTAPDRRLTPAEAAAHLGPAARGADTEAAFVRGVLPDRRGREGAPVLVWAAFFLLVLEGWLATSGAGARARP